MNKKSKIYLLFLLSIFIFVGCIPSKKRNQIIPEKKYSNTSITITPISKTINDKFSINIDSNYSVSLPISLFTIKKRRFDVSDFNNIFKSNFNRINNETISNEIVYKDDNNNVLTILPGMFFYMKSDVLNKNYGYLKSKVKETTNLKDQINEIPGISLNNSLKISDDLLKDLKVDFEKTPKIFAVNRDVIDFINNESIGSPKNKTYKYSEEDQMYIFEYSLIASDNIPYNNKLNYNNEKSSITIFVNNNGIKSIIGESIFAENNPLKNVNEIVSSTQIVDSFFNELKNVINIDNIELSNISLNIVPINNEKDYEQKLVWILETNEKKINNKNNKIEQKQRYYIYSAEDGTILN